jgi:hypothetical protein
MAYIIVKTDGTVLTTISDGTVDTSSTSLSLPGRNYASYGQVFDTNFAHLLENFADSIVPTNPIRGQLWFNTNTQSLYVCPTDGETNINNWFILLTASNGTASFVNLTLSGNLFANNAVISSNLTSNSITTSSLTVNLNSNLLGTTNVANLRTSNITANSTIGNLNGNWTVTGNLTPVNILSDNYFYSNGTPITFGLSAGNTNEIQFNSSDAFAASSALTFNPTSNTLSVVGNINSSNYAGNANGLSSIPAANLTGIIATAVQSNITQLGNLATMNVTSVANIANINVSGAVIANRLTGVLTSNAQPNVTSLGTLTSLISTGVVNFINASNVSLGPISNVKITGGVNGDVLMTNGAGDLSWINPITIPAQPAGSSNELQYNDSGILGASPNLRYDKNSSLLTLTGNLVTQNANLGNSVTANYFSGNGSSLSAITGANVTGTVLNAAIAAVVTNPTQSNITAVGTLVTLDVSGNSALGNFAFANYFIGNGIELSSITGANVIGTVANASYAVIAGTATSIPAANITGSVANASYADNAGTATSATTAATVTSAAQPNITSVGTLNTLSVSGNITGVGTNSINNFRIGVNNPASGAFTNLTASGTASVTGNITGGNISTAGIISASGNITGNVFVGNAAGLTNIVGANVTGTVANATYAAAAGLVATANTVSNSAQPNITSVGPLANLSVIGTSTFGEQLNVPITGIRFANLNYPSGTQNAYLNFSTWSSGFGLFRGTKVELGINSTNSSDYVNLAAPNGARVNGFNIYTNNTVSITSGLTFAYNFTNIVGSFSDAANYFDVFPPSGYSMDGLIGFIPSIGYIYFSGVVNSDDSMRCVHSILSDRVRVYVQNTEQRLNPAANYLAIWRR